MAKTEFGKKIENYWYHYKWHTLIALFFIIVLTVNLVQCATRVTADSTILYGGPRGFNEDESREINDAFSSLLDKDLNGDGKTVAELISVYLLSDEQYSEFVKQNGNVIGVNEKSLRENHTAFSNHVFAGESVILLLDPTWFKEVRDAGGLRKLDEVLSTVPDYAIDGYGIRLKDTQFAKSWSALNVFPDDTIVCVRNVSTSSFLVSQETQQEKYDYQIALFKRIIEFRPE